MLRDVMVFSLLLLLCVALTSCDEVVWENPLSGAEETPGDTRLPGAWGIVDPKTGSKVEVLCIGKPVDGWMSFVAFSQADSQTKCFGKMRVSKSNRRTFLDIKIEEDNENRSGIYHILEYEINGRRLRLFYPASGDFVEQAVEEGRISGEGIGEGGMLIHSSSREVWEFITKCQREKLFKRLDFEPIIKFR
jgi:hypothetical protein